MKPTSPLGTADQIALEQKAQEIVNTPQVQAAIEALKQAWLAHAQQRFGLVGGVDAKNLALLDQAAREQALNAAMTVVNNDPDNPLVMAVDMRAHSWYGTDTPGGRFIYDNPDTIYRTIPVRSDSTYVASHARPCAALCAPSRPCGPPTADRTPALAMCRIRSLAATASA